jgi:hypothetical protein
MHLLNLAYLLPIKALFSHLSAHFSAIYFGSIQPSCFGQTLSPSSWWESHAAISLSWVE